MPVGPVVPCRTRDLPFYLLHQHIGYAAYFLLVPAIGFGGTTLALIAGLTAVALLISGVVETPAARAIRAFGAGVRALPLLGSGPPRTLLLAPADAPVARCRCLGNRV
ncbi:MAG: hypothetical protein HPM95_08760 [Alphaproteobacteria bacterium]|nr:hypothetical protein [Alphaproteobacteria bacterium]